MLRVLELARICKDLCDTVNAIPSINFTVNFDSRFSLTDKNEEAVPSSPSTSASRMAETDVSTPVGGEPNSSDHNCPGDVNGEGDDGEAEVVSSDMDDMEGYESDTSSSSSGDDVVVEGCGDSEEEEVLEEDEAMVMANIEELKVHVCHA